MPAPAPAPAVAVHAPPQGEQAAGDALLVPFTRAVVPAIDFAARRIIVDPPLLDDGQDTDNDPTKDDDA